MVSNEIKSSVLADTFPDLDYILPLYNCGGR